MGENLFSSEYYFIIQGLDKILSSEIFWLYSITLTYISSECLDSIVIHRHGNNISPTPLLSFGRWCCCVADEGSEFGGGERELRNIIILKTNKRMHITVIATSHYVPGQTGDRELGKI